METNLPKPDSQVNRSFLIVFALVIVIAAIGTIGNLLEYRNSYMLNTFGKRTMGVTDSLAVGAKSKEIFVKFRVRNKVFNVNKKVKTNVAVGDSIPVYYLEDDPAVNGIATE